MSFTGRVSRGDVLLLPIAFVSGVGSKVRPAVVVQNDNLNARLIDISTPEGRQTGLLHNSTVKCEHLDTVDQRDIVRVIGRFPPALLAMLEGCIKAALAMR